MTRALIVCALLLLAALAQAAMKDYSFSVVYRITMQKEEQINALFELEDQGKVDVWSEKMGLGVDVDIRLAPEHHNEVVTRLFKELNTPHKIYIDNVQTLIDEERMNLAKLPGFGANSAADDFFVKYRTADEFNTFLKTLNAQYPDLTELFSIGKTLHGNDINGIRITGKKAAGKPAVVYNGGQHAREWISPMVVAYIANELLSKYATDDTIKQLVEEIEWNLVPIVNVDGYLYTWSKDRLWRKNMRENPHCSCKGVDPNRNWGYQWNATGGSSTNCCSETYRGPAPFSEPESLAIATFANTTQNLKAYIDFHSYSQLWMRPWGFTTEAPKNEAVAKEIGDACAAAIKNTHGVVYESGRISIIIYEASGSSVDFVYYYTDAISFGVELRDTGRYGFLLPPQQIVPTGEEVVAAAVRTIGTYILKHKI